MRRVSCRMLVPPGNERPPKGSAGGAKGGLHWEYAIWPAIFAVFWLLRALKWSGGPDLRVWFLIPALFLAVASYWRWRTRKATRPRG